MQTETEIVPTWVGKEMKAVMKNEDFIITKEQAEALGPMGIAFMYESEAWWRVEENGSLYQNVHLPEGYVQVELKTDGSLRKYPDTKRLRHNDRTTHALSFVLGLLTDEQEAAYREYLGVEDDEE